MPKDEFRFRHEIRIRWSECDYFGTMYRPHCIGFIEVAMAEYFRDLGVPTYDETQWSYSETSLANGTIEFKSRARVDELLDIYLRASSICSKTITFETEVYRQEPGELLAVATLVYESYDPKSNTNPDIPQPVRSLISQFEGH